MSGSAEQQVDEVFEDFKDTAYRLVRPLAHGGMGSVFEAEHVKLARPCVIKLLLPALSSRPEIIERLIVEGRVLANIEHENLVRVTDLGATPGGRVFIAMELLDGSTLRAHLTERPTVPPLEAIGLLLQVLRGLSAAHKAQVVHRDVKLDNIFVCAPNAKGERTVKLLDFGIAKVLSGTLKGEARFPTAEGMVMGTPMFMSPEQASARPVDARSDIYSAGVVLFRAVVGEVPFLPPPTLNRDHAMIELFKMHVEKAPPVPSSVAPQPLPAALDACILKALAKQPRDRYQSAAEFAEDLERVGTAIRAELASRPGKQPELVTEVMPRATAPATADPTTLPIERAYHRVPTKRASSMALYVVIALVSAGVFTLGMVALFFWLRTG